MCTNVYTITFSDDDEEAKLLAKQVRILCWVMTAPQNVDTKAQHVKNTWGKRCNILLFISSVTNDSFPTIGINSVEGYRHLTAKTMFAFRYIYEHYFDKADWFMKADDDTYVIVENLRYFLSGENPDDPVYFGRHFVNFMVNQGYTSGGGGYVISKEALRRFGKNPGYWCSRVGGAEDVQFGACMQSIGVKVGNSSDAFGRSRFHCFKLESHLKGDDYPKWFYKYDSHNARHVSVSRQLQVMFSTV